VAVSRRKRKRQEVELSRRKRHELELIRRNSPMRACRRCGEFFITVMRTHRYCSHHCAQLAWALQARADRAAVGRCTYCGGPRDDQTKRQCAACRAKRRA
jgi:hypothetical protein